MCYHHNCIVLAQITMDWISIILTILISQSCLPQQATVWMFQIPKRLAIWQSSTCYNWNVTVFIKMSCYIFNLIKTWDSAIAPKQCYITVTACVSCSKYSNSFSQSVYNRIHPLTVANENTVYQKKSNNQKSEKNVEKRIWQKTVMRLVSRKSTA